MQTSKSSRPPNPDQIESTAADWLARRDAGWRGAEQERFERWLDEDPRHAAAWAALDSTWSAFDRPRSTGAAAAMIRILVARQRRRRSRQMASLGTAAALAAAALVFVAMPKAPIPAGAGEAVLSKVERRVLADGSVVELNRGASIDVNYHTDSRSVLLTRGEAHFTVAKNSALPFVVTAGGVKVRDLGTAFAVQLGPQEVSVIVTEGRVAVETSGARPILVPAGQCLVVPVFEAPSAPPKPEVLASSEMERRLSWRGPRLELSATPLSRAIAVFNRENAVQISIADPRLGDVRMSGIFRADNAEGFVRLLEASYGVTATRLGGGEIVLRKEP